MTARERRGEGGRERVREGRGLARVSGRLRESFAGAEEGGGERERGVWGEG